MYVKDIMTKDVKTCWRHDSLNDAAKLFWDHDCGCSPVVDEEQKVVGMLTDRDLCMAAYFKGKPLGEIPVDATMSRQVCTCKADDTLVAAEKLMRSRKVRRLPVTDAAGRIVGIISLNDIALEAARERTQQGRRELSDAEVSETLAAVSEHRQAPPPHLVVSAA